MSTFIKNSILKIKKQAETFSHCFDVIREQLEKSGDEAALQQKEKLTKDIQLLHILILKIVKDPREYNILKDAAETVYQCVENLIRLCSEVVTLDSKKVNSQVLKAGNLLNTEVYNFVLYFEPVGSILPEPLQNILKEQFDKLTGSPCVQKKSLEDKTTIYIICRGYREEILSWPKREQGILIEQIQKEMARYQNVHEVFDRLVNAELYKDWFYQFLHLINLLESSDPKTISKEQIVRLLKFALMRFQLNATYSLEDSERLFRQTSPLVFPGYGRGIRTGLWEAAKIVLKAKIEAQSGQKNFVLSKNFHVLPLNRPYTFQSTAPKTVKTVPESINAEENIYISDLGVQLIMDPGKVNKKTIDHDLGAQGLRRSPSDCAELCADFFADLIQNKKTQTVFSILEKIMIDNGSMAVDVSKKLSEIELCPNTLLVLNNVNPLLQTSDAINLRLLKACQDLKWEKQDAFYIQHNIGLVKNLIGTGETMLFTKNTPEIISALLIDLMEQVTLLLDNMRNARPLFNDSTLTLLMNNLYDNKLIRIRPFSGKSVAGVQESESYIAFQYRMEKFYQLMQEIHEVCRFQLSWLGNQCGLQLEKTLRTILPSEAPKPAQVITVPHGLLTFSAVVGALDNKQLTTGILEGAYYETPDLFPQCEMIAHVKDVKLKTKTVIVAEPHPNNAAKRSIQPHNIKELLVNLFGEDTGTHTVILDITLNYLREPEIREILTAAQQHISNGKLNLILVQSGTKFLQHGMDIVNLGICWVFNNDSGIWSDFNTKLLTFHQNLPIDDQRYIARLFDTSMDELAIYLQKIRKNTETLRTELQKRFDVDSAYCLCDSTDTQTCYIAFRLHDEIIKSILKKDQILDSDIACVNQYVYKNTLLPMLKKNASPSIDRTSFGFNITNFGECHTTIRITPGIEEDWLLQLYANTLASVGRVICYNLDKIREDMQKMKLIP